MFKVNDLVFYGNEGVCSVDDICTLDISNIDNNKLYYVLRPLYRDGKIYSPVDSDVYMRPIIVQETVQELIDQIPDMEVEVFNSKSLREVNDYYKTSFELHNCKDLIRLIKTVHTKKTMADGCKKKLGLTDENYMKRAEELLYGEFAAALEIPKDEVKDYIKCRIEAVEHSKQIGSTPNAKIV